MQLRKSSGKSISIPVSREIVQLARELNISLDPEAVRNAVRLGTKSLSQESELEHTLKKLEETKKRLASNFRRIAYQTLQLESKCVGTRSQFATVSRDNRVLAIHLCARSPKGKREGQLRDQLIQKYIMNYRKA
jgi:hypothetical protein